MNNYEITQPASGVVDADCDLWRPKTLIYANVQRIWWI